MNTWPDGRPVTSEELEAMALEHGLITSEKLANIKVDMLHTGAWAGYIAALTSELCFEMMCRGELKLKTAIHGPKENRPWRLNEEVLSYVTRKDP